MHEDTIMETGATKPMASKDTKADEMDSAEEHMEEETAIEPDKTAQTSSHPIGSLHNPLVMPKEWNLDIVQRSSDPSFRTLLILGKTGAGKVAVAKHIFKNESKSFHSHSSVDSVMRQADINFHDDTHTMSIPDSHEKLHVRVVIIDTHGLRVNYTTSEISKKLQDIKKVNAIFFVMKYGRVTKDDCKPLRSILENMDKHNMCHLVITGCEGQSETARASMIEMYRADDLTKDICSAVGKNILPVGLPDLETVDPKFHQDFQADITNDERRLQDIVKDSSDSHTLRHTTNSMCLIL